MTEQRHEVKVFEVEYKCDHCHEGVMRLGALMQPTLSPKYQHNCNKCGAVECFLTVYPCIRYERVDTDNPYATLRTPMEDLKTCTNAEIKMIDSMNDKLIHAMKFVDAIHKKYE